MSETNTWNQELSLIVALFIPLGILAVAVAYVPLEAYGNPDPRAFVARSIRLAEDWSAVTSIKDPPLRYFPLAFVYSIIDPPGRQAAAIGAAFGSLSVYVVSPLAIWAFARRAADSRVALLVLAGIIANIVLAPTEHWARPVAAWQYYVTLPLILAAFVSVDWTLASQQSRRRAIITGLLIGAAGLTQVLFAGIAALVVAVACLLERRLRTLVEITLTALPFAGYYLVSMPAQEQIFKSISGRTASEPLFPITPVEIVFLAVVLVGIVLWYRERRAISSVIGAGLLVSGGLWSFAVLTSGEYLSYFLPVLAVPLMLTGLSAGVCATADRYSLSDRPRRAYADGGVRTLPWRFLAPVLALFSIALTIVLLDAVLPTYPFWAMG